MIMGLGNNLGALVAGMTVLPAIFALSPTAALSSLLPMIEVGVRNVMDMGMDRKKATITVIIVGFLLGIPSAYSLKFLDNQDWVWGVGLLVSGLCVAMALIKYGLEELRTKEINIPEADFKVGKWWSTCIRLFPVLFVIILGWWVKQAISWYPGNWWNPLETFSVGTIVMQWILLIAFALITQNYLNKKIVEGPMTGSRLKNPSKN